MMKEKSLQNRKQLSEEDGNATIIEFQQVSASWLPPDLSKELFTGEERDFDETDDNDSILCQASFRLS